MTTGPPAIRLLIADDDAVSRMMVERSVQGPHTQVFTAKDGKTALEIMRDNEIHIAILDWMMPHLSGIQLCRHIRRQKSREYRYIILCTARNNPADIVKGLNAGADDYITKPYNTRELEARLKIGKRIIDLQRKLLRAQEELRRIAVHDGLTGLLNHREINRILEKQCIRSSREKQPLGVVMLDIDHFKAVNDHLGHQAGDAVLIEVARRIRQCLRPYDMVGRYGGEEFLVILPNCDRARSRKAAERIRHRIAAHTVTAGGVDKAVTASLGVAVLTPGGKADPVSLIRRSDKALYIAKGNGRNRVEMEIPRIRIFHKGEDHESQQKTMGAIPRSP